MPSPTRPSISRRHFLWATTAGAAAPALSAADQPAPPLPPATISGDTFQEPAQSLPLNHDADVIVCGGGPAGIAAAISAARAGAKVRLFEWRGCLGGVWTAGLLGYLLDFNKPGFAQELSHRLEERGARNGTSASSICYDPEAMKQLLEEMCLEAGVQFQFHTRVAAAFKSGRRLSTIITESKAGRQAWSAPTFIDTTGDGDLGSLAGCAWEIGEAQDCPCQPMSLNALLVVKDAAALAPFIHGADPSKQDTAAKNALRAEIEKTGHFPSYSKPTIWQIRDNLLLVMMNHEYGVKPYDAAQVTQATVRARAELHKIVNGLRKLGGPWEGVQIAATAEQIGVRDGRRIAGRYTVGKDDLIQGVIHEDAVVKPTFPVDIHAISAEHNKSAAYHNAGVKVKPYDIPVRALLAKDVDGLMMAGRCISGDFIAHASYRVTGNAVAMGEAAGVVSALAAKSQRLPHEVPWSEVKDAIAKIRTETAAKA